MASNGWETVGKKKNNKNQIKNHKKHLTDDTNHKDSTGQIAISDSNFSVFANLEERKLHKQQQNNTKSVVDQNNENEVIDKKLAKSKPKKKPVLINESPKKTTKPLTFEQLAKELKVSEFEKVAEETKVKFPDMPLIWLKDIAYFLNGKFQYIEPEDVTFADKSFDYPSSALPQSVIEFINRNIRQCPQPILQLIQEQLLQSLVKQSTPTMGFRIILQCISSQYPDFTVNNIQKFIQHRISYCNRQQVCLSILWVASQSNKKDLKSGLNIWLELMLPIIQQKAYTKYIIDSLNTLLAFHLNSKLPNEVLSVKQFFTFFDFIHTPANGMTLASQKQLDSIYLKFKLISIYNNSKTTSRLYFPHLFERLEWTIFSNNRSELLSELTKCLASDNQCFSVWRTLYAQNLTQSAKLLEYLANNYRTLPSSLSIKLLNETVLSFKNTNEDTILENRSPKEGQEACEHYAQTLLNIMSNWKLPIKSILMVLTVLVAVLLAYDTKSHGSFQKSYTGNVLKQTGTLPVVEQAYNKIEVYSLIAYSWLSINMPVYFKSVSEVVSPYLNVFWAKFAEVMVYLWNSTEVIRVWINKTIPPILETITDEYMPKVQSFVWQFTTQVHSYLSTVWALLLKYWIIVSNWLQTNVLTGSLAPENIQKVLIQAIDVLQSYMSEAFQWTANQYKALTN